MNSAKNVVNRSERQTVSTKKALIPELSKTVKRQWREALHRAALAAKTRLHRRALLGIKARGKDLYKMHRAESKAAEGLRALFEQKEPEYQSGFKTVFGVGAAAVAGLTASKIASAVADTSSNVASLADLIRDEYKKLVDQISKFGASIWKGILLGFTMWLLVHYAHVPLIPTLVVGAAIHYLPDIKNSLNKFLPETIKFQSGATSLVSAFITMLATLWVPHGSNEKMVGELLKRVTMFPRACEGVECFLSKIVDCLETCVNAVLGRGDNPINFKGQMSAYEIWKRQVIAVIKDMAGMEEGVASFDVIRRAKNLHMAGYGFYATFTTAESKRELDQWIEKLNVKMLPHAGALQAVKNVRPTPYMLVLGGGSGKGKTSALRLITSTILMASGLVEPKHALQNMHQPGTGKYANGYVGQLAYIYDDAFQVKPKQGDMQSEAMNIIKQIGNWTCPLEFADVYSKGKYCFTSPLVLATTNCENIHAEWAPYIASPDALVRRFQGAYWIDVSDEFSVDGKYDFSKAEKAIHDSIAEVARRAREATPENPMTVSDILDIMPWHIWKVYTHDFKSSFSKKDQAPDLTMRDVIITAADEIRSRQQAHKQSLADMQQYVNAFENIVFQASSVNSSQLIEPLPLIGDPNQEYYIAEVPIADDANASWLDDLSTEDLETLSSGTSVDYSFAFDTVDLESSVSQRAPSNVPIPAGDFVARHDVLNRHMGIRFANPQAGHGRRDRAFAARNNPNGEIRSHNILQPFENAWMWCEAKLEQMYYMFAEKLHSEILATFATVGFGCVIGHFAGKIVPEILKAGVSLLFKAVKGILKTVGILVSGILGLLGIKKGKAVAEQSGEPTTVKTNPPTRHIDLASFNDRQTKAQVGVPPVEDVHRIIFENSVRMKLRYSIGGSPNDVDIGNMLGLGESVYLIPRHFRTFLEEAMCVDADATLRFYSAKWESETSMPVSSFLKLKSCHLANYDAEAVSFGVTFLKSNRNILKFFLAQHEIKSILKGSNIGVRLDVLRTTERKVNGTVTTRANRSTYYSPTCTYVGDLTVDGTLNHGTVSYKVPSVKGDCGSPLTIAENRFYGTRCIMGIHIAGREGTFLREGFSTIISQEFAREMWTRLTSYSDETSQEELITVLDSCPEANAQAERLAKDTGLIAGSFEFIGKLSKPINLNLKTNLKRTSAQDLEILGPSPMQPAILHPVVRDGETVYPMVKGLQAYQSPLEFKDIPDLDCIVDIATERFVHETRSHRRSILTFEESIVPPNELKLKPINRKTSAGFKYREYVTAANPGKTAFLGHEGEVDFSNPLLQMVKRDSEDMIEAAKRGERKLNVNVDFPKDEPRSLKKIFDVATRVISAPNFDYTSSVRQYFGAIAAAQFSTSVLCGLSPGIIPTKEWDKLKRFVMKHGSSVFDGDFSRFDASEQPWLHEAILRFINRWYKMNNPEWKEEDDKVREILWLDLIHSRHICGVGSSLDTMVQWNKSLPSGHPLTTLVNSLYSLISLVICYVKITGRTDFWEQVAANTFGDDNLCGVSDEIKDTYNQVTVAGAMGDLGLVYTAGCKDGKLVPYTTIDKVTYLKRSFADDNDPEVSLVANCPNVGTVAPLAIDSFLYLCYWYKNERSKEQDMKQRLEQCFAEMSLHPQEMWDEYFPIINQWCVNEGLEVPFTSRRAARIAIKTRFDTWF